MRQSLCISVALLCLALVLPAGAGAAEPWGAANTVARAADGAFIGAPEVGVDARGGIAAAWTLSTRRSWSLWAVRRSGGRYGPLRELRRQRNGIDSPVIAFDANRSALIAYRRFVGGNYRIESRALRPSGSLTAAQLLSGSGRSAFAPVWVTDAVERPLLFWTRGASEPDLQFARPRGNGTFASTTRYDISGAESLPDVAVDAAGAVYAAVVRPDATTRRPRVYVARQAPGQTSATVVAVSDGVRRPREPQIVVGRRRGAVVVWTESDGSSERIVTAERGTDGVFSAPAVLATGAYAAGLKTTITSNDQVLAAWIASDRGTAWGSLSGRLNMAAVTSTPSVTAVSPPSQRVDGFALTSDGEGGATVGYLTDAAGNPPGGHVYASAITPGGRFGTVFRLTRSGERALGGALDVGLRGDAAAAWTASEGRTLRIARRPAG